MRIKRPVVAEKVVTPDIADELFTRQRNALVLDKIEKEVVFLGRQVSLLTVDVYDSAGKIHL